jgi:hypothetical protein
LLSAAHAAVPASARAAIPATNTDFFITVSMAIEDPSKNLATRAGDASTASLNSLQETRPPWVFLDRRPFLWRDTSRRDGKQWRHRRLTEIVYHHFENRDFARRFRLKSTSKFL